MPKPDQTNKHSTNIRFEEGVLFLVKHSPPSKPSSRKPILFHDIRVGVYLYEQGYPEDVVLAGLLHDTLEWSSATTGLIKKKFGQKILGLIQANTKDDSIKNNDKKILELIQRCAKHGEKALIIKAADIIDSFKWYNLQNNTDELKYCYKTAKAILKYKKVRLKDPIFKELATWVEKVKKQHTV